MHSMRSAIRRPLALLTSAALVCAGLTIVAAPVAFAAGPAPIEQRSPANVTADPLPTVQIDSGVVWSQVVVGDTVYAGGRFANTRPAGAAPGQNLTPRANLLAYNIKTGQLVTSFNPVLNGQVKVLTVSPDKKRLYVGGQFTKADNLSRFNIAAYDLATGALITTWKPAMGGSYVNAIAASNTTVYIGGLLTAANGVTIKNLAAVNASDGKLTGWNPTTDRQVDTMVLTPTFDKVIVGGRFAAVNGVDQRGLVALNPTTGAKIEDWAAPKTVKNGLGTGTNAGNAGIYSLSTDGVSIFGTGWVYGGVATGNLEGSFKAQPGSGVIDWLEDCHGDTYSAYSDTNSVYEVGHKHDCVTVGGYPQLSGKPGNMRHAVAFTNATKGVLSKSPSSGTQYADWSGQPAPAMIDWFPEWVTGSATGQGQAAWTVTGTVLGTDRYVVFGGEFPYVNGIRQQGLVRFATPSADSNPPVPKKEGPRLAGADWVPTLQTGPNAVRLNMAKANWDRDDLSLTYQVVRDGVTASNVQSQVVKSTFWNRPALTFLDTGVVGGSTHTYLLTATDPDGNKVQSASASIVVKK